MSLPSNLPRKLVRSCGWLWLGLLFAGCSHLYYADPNPQSAFVFPGQNSAPSPAQPAFAPVGVTPTIPGPTAATANPPSSPVSDVLHVGDALTISFSDIPPPGLLPSAQRIRDDGKITLPFNIILIAAGKTVGQLQEDIRNAYVPSIFKQMTASIKTEQRVFFVEGEVKLPQRLVYEGEMTVLRAITSAGGLTDFANRKKIELRRSATGQKFLINWYNAIKDPKLDLPVYPNDQIIVRKKLY